MNSFYKEAINEESGYLLDESVRNSNLCKDEVGIQKKENQYITFSKSSFLFKFFIFILLFSFILIVFYTISFFTHKPNFKINKINWDLPDLNDRKYENYIFDNGLEVMIIHDPKFNRDGGSIVIESGYMDNPFNEGIATFATHLLSHMAFPDINKYTNLKDYYGRYNIECGRYYTYYVFDILNSGFTKFLSDFSLILNSNFTENFDTDFKNYIDVIIKEMDNSYYSQIRDVDYRELHLIEYLVFGLKNSTGDDILPKGNSNSLKKYTLNELKSKVKEYIEQLIDTRKIKIVLFSRFKTSISSKYMKKFFKFLTTMEKPTKISKNEFIVNEFKTSQLFFAFADYYDINYIDILYYIDKINSESFSELFYKANYLNYIIDFLTETKEGSLYHLLTNSSNHNIKKIYAGYDIIFKSKIEFYIYIQLNCLKNINNIIYLTYQFMNKIVKQAIGNNTQFERYIELKNQYFQDLKYSEKPLDTFNFATENAVSMIEKKFFYKYFFYKKYIPWNDSNSYNNNINIIKNETYHYFKQLKPENSVIFLGLRIKNLVNLTCNASSPFYLDCDKIKYETFNQSSNYYQSYFKNYTFNSSFEKDLDIDDNTDISFIKNNYTSKNNESYINQEEEEQKIELISNESNYFSKFYFKRNINFKVPKVFISLYFLHPFLRPMNKNDFEKKCYYFQIMELFSGIKRKVNEALANAIRSGNQISFGQDEEYLYLNVFCYEDVAYEIMKTIKMIIFETKWESTDFKYNNEIYKNEAFDDFFIFDKFYVENIAQYYLYYKLKNNIYNKYEFYPDEFEKYNYTSCLSEEFKFNYLTSFIVNGYIYGYYTREEAQKICDLFETNYENTYYKEILFTVGNPISPENFTNWIKQVNQLNESDKVYIDEKVYNKYEENINYGVCYAKIGASPLDIYIFNSILQRVSFGHYLIFYQMIIVGDIYFELLFYDPEITSEIPNDKLIESEWNYLLNNFDEFNKDVDDIGNRYYYVKKNLISSLIDTQTSLVKRAQNELREYFYDGLIIDPKKIIDEYNNNYDKYKQLNDLIKEFGDILDKKIYEVHTVGK